MRPSVAEPARQVVVEQPYVVSEVDARTPLGVELPEDAPGLDAVEGWMRERINIVSGLDVEGEGPILRGEIVYNGRVLDSEAGERTAMVMIDATLERVGQFGPGEEVVLRSELVLRRPLEAEVPPNGETVPSLEVLVQEAVSRVVDELDSQAQAHMADEEALVDFLRSPNVSDRTRLVALHQVREQKVERAVPELRRLLRSGNDEIVIASAAALAHIRDEAAAAEIIDAAERMSRQDKRRELIQLLYILGETEDRGALEYLRSLEEAHEDPQVQETAREIFERTRQRPRWP